MARGRDLVVLGASAGGVEALRDLAALLPADLPATLLVVLHVPPTGRSALPEILGRAGPLPVRHAREGDPLEPGTILVAPPDRHLIVYDDAVTLSRGPKENGHRPSVDVLFRSAAHVAGTRTIGVVLSGALDDGSAGMVAIKLRGGYGIVQDPEEALYGSMPRSAAAAAEVDDVLPLVEIAELLDELTRQEAPAEDAESTTLMDMEAAMADLELEALTNPDRPGEPSGWTCPDCHGALFSIEEGGLQRYRCRVGHAWSPDSLVAQQTSAYESALWIALRTLEEKASLTRELGRRASAQGHRLTGEQFQREAAEAQESAALLRGLIDGRSDEPVAPLEPGARGTAAD